MDDTTIRETIQTHADSVVRGDMDAIVADFSEKLRPHLQELGRALPQPVMSAEVLSVEVGDPETVAMIRYSGDSGDVTIRSHWRDLGGEHAVIVHAEPAG